MVIEQGRPECDIVENSSSLHGAVSGVFLRRPSQGFQDQQPSRPYRLRQSPEQQPYGGIPFRKVRPLDDAKGEDNIGKNHFVADSESQIKGKLGYTHFGFQLFGPGLQCVRQDASSSSKGGRETRGGRVLEKNSACLENAQVPETRKNISRVFVHAQHEGGAEYFSDQKTQVPASLAAADVQDGFVLENFGTEKIHKGPDTGVHGGHAVVTMEIIKIEISTHEATRLGPNDRTPRLQRLLLT